MLVSVEGMLSVLYSYQINEITEGDEGIILEGIMSAEAEVRGYFEASNARREVLGLTAQAYRAYKIYDTEAIFEDSGDSPNAFIARLVKTVAAWNICELANVDVIYTHVKERYDNAIKTLEKIAGMGDYAGSQMFLAGLPSPAPTPEEEQEQASAKPFRSGSRPKFNHE
jgi:hypothetical protein